MVLSFVPSSATPSPSIQAADPMRRVVEKLEGTHRLLLHAASTRTSPGDLEGMDELKEKWGVSAWKTYTQWGRTGAASSSPTTSAFASSTGAQARREEHRRAQGPAFRAAVLRAQPVQRLGVVAKRFPDVNFLIYHSGFVTGVPEEAYEPGRDGINTLVSSLQKNSVFSGL